MSIHLNQQSNLSHYFRRFIHICIPGWFYLLHQGVTWAHKLGISHQLSITMLIITLGICETIRQKYQIPVYGMRSYEKHRISAFFWTISAFAMLILALPPQWWNPIIWTLALIDPIMGETRAILTKIKTNNLSNLSFITYYPNTISIILGSIVASGIWLYLSPIPMPTTLILGIALLSSISERIKIFNIDDNFIITATQIISIITITSMKWI